MPYLLKWKYQLDFDLKIRIVGNIKRKTEKTVVELSIIFIL